MAITKDTLVATIEIETGSSDKKLKDLKGQIEGNSSSFTALEKTLESLNKSIANLENIVGRFGKVLSGQQKEIKGLEDTAKSIQQTNAAIVDLSNTTEILSETMNSSIKQTSHDMGGFNDTLVRLKENLIFVSQIGLTGVVLAGANASGAFKGLGGWLKKTNINFVNLYEAATLTSAIMGSLALAIGHTDNEFLQFTKTILIAASVITGSFALKSHILLTIISNIAYNVGTVLVDAMTEWEKKSAKAAEVTRQFMFTLKGFGDVFGTDVIGSLKQWQGIITELVDNTTFSTQEVQKAVKIFVAEGKALGLSYKTNVDLLKRAADIAAQSGLSIEDVAIRIAQGLSGNSQSLIALGINISDAALAHSKYILASEKTVSQLTDQEKTQLRLNEIMEQTSPIIGAAEYQTNSIIGSQKQLQKAVDNLTIKIGDQSKAVIYYNRVLAELYTSFVKLPTPILDTIGVIIDFGGVFLKIVGSVGQYLTLILGVVTAHRLLNVVLMQSAAIQAASVITLNKINALFKIQAVSVVTASTIYATLSKIIGISLTGAFLSLLGLIKAATIAIYTNTAAILANPLFWKAIAIAGTIYYLVKAIQEVAASLGFFREENFVSIMPMDLLVATLDLAANAFKSLGSVIQDSFIVVLSGLVSAIFFVIRTWYEFISLFATSQKELEKIQIKIDELDRSLYSVSARGSLAFDNLRKGIVGNSEAIAQNSDKAKELAKQFDLAAISASKLEKAATGIDKTAIQLSITGDEADRLNLSLQESQQIVKKAGDAFIKTEGTKKEYLDQYIDGLKGQYKSEAQISKFRMDSLNEINKLTKSLTLEQLRSSGKVVEAIKLEYQEKKKDLTDRVSLLQKVGGVNTKQLKDIEKAQRALNAAEESEIANYLNKEKEDALKKVADNLKEQQKLLQDIEDKNSELNKSVVAEGLTARQAIIAQLEYQLALVDKQIERASELYGANSEVVQALKRQKALLEAQAGIDTKKLLPQLPSEIITKFWKEFEEGAKARWNRLKESFTNIKMPSMSFEGMADFGKQISTAGETLGVSIAEGASALFSYAAIAIDIIKQAPDFLKSAFLELPGILLDALIQIPAIIEQIMQEFPAIIEDFVKQLPGLLVNIAKKLPDFIIMLLEQIPMVVEAIAEALPEIIVIIIKNIPKMVGAILKAVINSVLGFIKGIGKGIQSLLTGKGIKLDKIVDTKGMEDKIKKLTGETGRLFSVENLMEAAKDPVQAIYDVVEGASKKAADALKEAWMYIMENIIQPIFDGLKAAWMYVYNNIIMPIYNVVRNAWLWVYDNVLKPIYNIVRDAWLWVYDNVIAPIAGVISSAWQWVVDNVITPMTTLGEKIAAPFREAIESAGRFFGQIGEAFKALFKLDFDGLKQAVSEAFGQAGETLKSIFAAVMNPIVDIFNGLISALNGLKIPEIGWSISAGKLGKWSGTLIPEIDLIPGEIDKLPRFAQGGFVENLGASFPGVGSDTVPAMLTPGEFIMNRKAVETNGLGLLSAMNRGQTPGGGDVYNINFEIQVDAKTTMDEGYIRGTLIPKMSEELRRASLDGKFVLSSRGIR